MKTVTIKTKDNIYAAIENLRNSYNRESLPRAGRQSFYEMLLLTGLKNFILEAGKEAE